MGSGASIEIPADADRNTIRALASEHYGEAKVAEVESKYDEWAKDKPRDAIRDLNSFVASVSTCGLMRCCLSSQSLVIAFLSCTVRPAVVKVVDAMRK